MTSGGRNWASGEGRRIARSLGQGLQLPEDVHYFFDGSDEALATWLQWHSIAITRLTCLVYLLFFTCIYYYYYYFGIIVDIVITGNEIGLYDGSQIKGCCRGN